MHQLRSSRVPPVLNPHCLTLFTHGGSMNATVDELNRGAPSCPTCAWRTVKEKRAAGDERNLDKSDWHGGVTLLLYLCLQSDIGDPASPGGGGHSHQASQGTTTRMYLSVKRVKRVHVDMLTHAHSDKHQRCHTKTGIQTEGWDPAPLLQSFAIFLRQNWLSSSFPHISPSAVF